MDKKEEDPGSPMDTHRSLTLNPHEALLTDLLMLLQLLLRTEGLPTVASGTPILLTDPMIYVVP